MQGSAAILDLKLVAENIQARQLCGASAALAAQDKYNLSADQWKTLLGYLPTETCVELATQMLSTRAGTIVLVCSMLLPRRRRIAVSNVGSAHQRGMLVAVL